MKLEYKPGVAAHRQGARGYVIDPPPNGEKGR